MNAKANLLQRTLLAFSIAMLCAAAPAGAATITVNTTTDAIGNDGFCSLREAVMAANTNTASSDTTNGCVAGEAAPVVDVINIPAGTYSLVIAPENSTPNQIDATHWQVGEYLATWVTSEYVITVPTPDATLGDLDITESVNLVGAGQDLTIINAGWVPVAWDVMAPGYDPKVDPAETSAGFGDRVFHVVANGSVMVDVQMSGFTAKGGKLTTVSGLLAPNTVAYSLRRNGGAVAVGVAAGAYDPLSSGGSGGAPPVIGPGGGSESGPTYTLNLLSLILTSNYAGDGGGLYNAATSTATGIVISGNRGNANGGGVYNDAGLTLLNSSVSGNSAEGGGGLFDTGSHTTTIIGSTVNANGGVGGGGLSSRSGVTVNVANSTVSGNFGFDVGGGIYTNGLVNLIHATVANNVSNSDASSGGSGINTFPSSNVGVSLRGTLLSGNLKGSDPAMRTSANCGKTSGSALNITSIGFGRGYNLSSDNTCLLAGTGDIQNVNAKILALANNGGLTLTHALEPTSPAINAATAFTGLTTDQRGVARDSSPDIGAFEYTTTDVPATSGGGGSKCFIATAAFGTPMQEDVRYLRAFRDEYLLTNNVGRKFVEAYYSMSPPVADYIREHETLRSVIRTGLKPLVELSRHLVSSDTLAMEK
jgi:CSLREA domain-containing protein